MRSKVHLTNVCTVDFDLDPSIPPLAKSLYRILKAHVKKGSDYTTSQFVRPSQKRLRDIMRIGTDKVQHNLRVLQLVGLVIVHPGKKIGKKNEVNQYEIIDDLFLYEPNANMNLGTGKDLFNETEVFSLFGNQDFPEPPTAPTPIEYSEDIKSAAGIIIAELEKHKSPGVVTDKKLWCKIIKELLDKYKETNIDEIIGSALYGIKDSFWTVHIISPAKFKSKFPTLYRQRFNKVKSQFGVVNNQQRSTID